jgi:protocatechuate 3,4-dioxygenase beta subunit
MSTDNDHAGGSDGVSDHSYMTAITSRRGFLATAAMGATGLVIASGTVQAATANAATTRSAAGRIEAAEAASCLAMTPVQEVGPFYVAYDHVRSNIRTGQSGIHLALHIKVINVRTCKPIHNAALDIWQANALGVYSDEQQEGTLSKTYLRGIQLTDASGRAVFKTIMPGWYAGRVEHIHAKVRLKGTDTNDVYSGGTTAHIGQMFFSQKVNDACAKVAPYDTNSTARISNHADRVYSGQGGARSHITVSGSPSKGYVGHITLGVRP